MERIAPAGKALLMSLALVTRSPDEALAGASGSRDPGFDTASMPPSMREYAPELLRSDIVCITHVALEIPVRGHKKVFLVSLSKNVGSAILDFVSCQDQSGLKLEVSLNSETGEPNKATVVIPAKLQGQDSEGIALHLGESAEVPLIVRSDARITLDVWEVDVDSDAGEVRAKAGKLVVESGGGDALVRQVLEITPVFKDLSDRESYRDRLRLKRECGPAADLKSLECSAEAWELRPEIFEMGSLFVVLNPGDRAADFTPTGSRAERRAGSN